MAEIKVAVVTGANNGIGFGIVKELCAKLNGVVYLTARDENRGKDALQELQKISLKAKLHQLDIDDSECIRRFAEYIKQTYGGLDVLVNNAGMAYKWASTEPFGEQAETSIRMNVLGTLALCKALFPLLRPYARVCNVSSSEGHLQKICGEEPAASELRFKLASPLLTERELVDLMQQFVRYAKEGKHRERGWPNSAYKVSKVGMAALTRIHQREFDNDPRPGLLVNSCHPGFIKTDLTSHLGTMNIEQGAVCPTYLALLPKEAQEPRGAFLWFDKQLVDWELGPVRAPF